MKQEEVNEAQFHSQETVHSGKFHSVKMARSRKRTRKPTGEKARDLQELDSISAKPQDNVPQTRSPTETFSTTDSEEDRTAQGQDLIWSWRGKGGKVPAAKRARPSTTKGNSTLGRSDSVKTVKKTVFVKFQQDLAKTKKKNLLQKRRLITYKVILY